MPYKAKYSGDERHKRALADTAQNIQVLTKAQIEDSGYTDLREILDAQPGITLGTGENGNAFGDRYIIRGQEARSDVFVDGLRDPGMTIRESFATEQVEISKGPSSSFAGRGTSGGAVYSVTKQATTAYDYTRLSTGFGTDKHTRLTVDTNQVINEDLAVRANLLYGYEQVPDRDPADRDRKGIALSNFLDPDRQTRPDLRLLWSRRRRQPRHGRLPGRHRAESQAGQECAGVCAVAGLPRIRRGHPHRPPALSVLPRHPRDQPDALRPNRQRLCGHRRPRHGPRSQRPSAGAHTISLSTHQGWQEVDYFVNQTNLHLDRESAA